MDTQLWSAIFVLAVILWLLAEGIINRLNDVLKEIKSTRGTIVSLGKSISQTKELIKKADKEQNKDAAQIKMRQAKSRRREQKELKQSER